ncbi:alpha/beta hydrolase [Spongiimicrobium salis]|uniref:alpha/beta hydrolase n=1 Tax=Spongiimicrobium salis TaxID=1667022 RepID=UPI00374D75DB
MQTKDLSLYHIIRPSKFQDDKPPVLFLFHGYGSNEEDLFSFAAELPEQLCIIAVRAPHNIMVPNAYAWYSINFDSTDGKWSDEKQAAESRDAIGNFIVEACNTYGLDEENVSILGFSQGAILSYALALSFPEKIKNVIALSGYVLEGILTEGYKEKDHRKLAVYTSHGTMDDVIPLQWAQRAPGLLKSLGISHDYQEFPIGHGVSPQNFYAFKTWLEQKI